MSGERLSGSTQGKGKHRSAEAASSPPASSGSLKPMLGNMLLSLFPTHKVIPSISIELQCLILSRLDYFPLHFANG